MSAEIQADRQAVLAANLKLTDAEGAAFWPLYREYRAEMGKVGDRLQKLIQDYAKIYDTATAEQAKPMVDEMLSIQQAELKIKEAYLPKFRKVIPEPQGCALSADREQDRRPDQAGTRGRHPAGREE